MNPFLNTSPAGWPYPPPLSLKKISIDENGEATVISYTSDNDFFKGEIRTFPVMRFLLELTQHIPPKDCQYIRRYGLYATLRRTARTKSKWLQMPHVVRLAPTGWKKEHMHTPEPVQTDPEEVRKILRHLVKIGPGRAAVRLPGWAGTPVPGRHPPWMETAYIPSAERDIFSALTQ